MLVVRLRTRPLNLWKAPQTSDILVTTYVQPTPEFTVVPHFNVDPLIQTESDQIQRLLDRVGGWLLQERTGLFNYGGFSTTGAFKLRGLFNYGSFK